MQMLAVLLVTAVMVFAVLRPCGLPEITAAAPAAGIALGAGLVSWPQARAAVSQMAPTVGFLAAILVLAHLADAMGVFSWIAAWLQRGASGSPMRLLAMVFVAASATTAILSLDATVVLLTPVVIATAHALQMDPRPHSYASAHLSNTASTLLPVSNLTNLLAFAATGLTFIEFAAVMALPWAVSIAVELLVFRLFFARTLRPVHDDSAQEGQGPGLLDADGNPPPRAALAVLALTLAGFAVTGFADVAPGWVAAAGSLVLAVIAMRAHRTTLIRMVAAADIGFCVFVLALGVVVTAVADGPVGTVISRLLPTEPTLLGLLVVAIVAAVISNLVNNLPATLLLLAALGHQAAPALVLAMLLGVNLGPNLTYVGSLAIMLWRKASTSAGSTPQLRIYTVLGLATVPAALIAGVIALWVSGRWLL